LPFIFTGQNDDFITFTNFAHHQPLQNFGSKGDDLHKSLTAQLTRYRPKNTSAYRLKLIVEQHCRIIVKFDQGTIRPAHTLGCTNHDCVVDITLFDPPRGAASLMLTLITSPTLA
jgi:hypothetical protein